MSLVENAYLGMSARERLRVGEGATPETETQIHILAQRLMSRYDLLSRHFDWELIHDSALIVGCHFAFIRDGNGVATLAKQLANYKRHKHDKNKLVNLIDCKLPTFILAYLYKGLIENNRYPAKVYAFQSFTHYPHPCVLLDIQPVLTRIDYHNYKGDVSGLRNDSLASIRENPMLSYSVSITPITDPPARLRHLSSPLLLPLEWNSLHHVDMSFVAAR